MLHYPTMEITAVFIVYVWEGIEILEWQKYLSNMGEQDQLKSNLHFIVTSRVEAETRCNTVGAILVFTTWVEV